MIRICLALILAAVLSDCALAAPTVRPALIPLPASVQWSNGEVPIRPDTIVEGQGNAASTATYMAETMGLKQGAHGASKIRLSIVPTREIAGPEDYHLRADGKLVLVEASDPRGLFYCVQTLR